MKRIIVLSIFLAAVFGVTRPGFGQESGTLVFVLKNYTSDAKLPKKAAKGLEHAGLRWGVMDHSLVIPIVDEKFVKADSPYLTRFGEQKSLEMKAGEYTITCVGFEFNSTSSDPDKTLAKSAYFNNDVVTFTVLPGKTTTLEVSPTYEAESAWKALSKFTMYIPDLSVQVVEDGAPKGEGVVINRRTARSVAWGDYHGPLKF